MQRGDVVPTAFTGVDWQLYIRTCKDEFGYDPTSVLSKSKIELKDPTAYITSLGAELEHSWAQKYYLEHSWLSIMTRLESGDVLLLQRYVSVSLLTQPGEVVILSGTIRQWFDSILAGCHELAPKIVNRIASKVLDILCTTRYKIMFERYTRIRTNDGLWILLIK